MVLVAYRTRDNIQPGMRYTTLLRSAIRERDSQTAYRNPQVDRNSQDSNHPRHSPSKELGAHSEEISVFTMNISCLVWSWTYIQGCSLFIRHY